MRPFSLRQDLPLLHDAITDTGAGLVIVDPLNAFLGGVDSHKAAEVRGILSPLAHVAAAIAARVARARSQSIRQPEVREAFARSWRRARCAASSCSCLPEVSRVRHE